jgi:hypothetical protein
VSTALALILMQAAAMPSLPVSPWDGQLQTFVCSAVTNERAAPEYVLTLTDTDAFIVGQEPGQGLQMASFVAFENLPSVVRGQAVIRRLSFPVGPQVAFVRQLYQAGAHVSTFISVGADVTPERDLPFETLAGFCQIAALTDSEAEQ